MGDVVSLGSVNVDHVVRADGETLSALAGRYDWFPDPGETVAVDSFPAEFGDLAARHFLGGKGANQAVAAARAGANAALLGAVGTDQADYDVLDSLAGHGVGVEAVEIADERSSSSPPSQAHEDADAPTGAAYIFVDEAGENYIAITAGANGEVDRAYVRRHRDRVLAADVLLLQNELPVEPIDDLLGDLDGRADRPTVVLDPAPAGGVEPLLAHDSVDVVTPNEAEYDALREALADVGGTVIRTRGPGDVLVEGPESFAVTPPAVEPVDTTGAGDVFAGFLAARLAAGDDLRTAVELAAAAAARSVTREGVQRATPSLAEIHDALGEHDENDR